MVASTLWEREVDFLHVIKEMEYRGVRVDKELAARELEMGQERCLEIKEDLGMDPGKPGDLKKLLLDELKLPVVKRSVKTNAPSFDKVAMAEYEELLTYSDTGSRQVAEMILEYRGWKRTCSSNYSIYLNKVSHDGRIRPHYNLHTVRTGRTSCSEPNLQQVPRTGNLAKRWNSGVKACFVADEGYTLYECDYSQLEFRLAAAYAEEQVLLDAFNGTDENGKKRDVFTEMSQLLNQARQDCKTFTYAKLYGAMAKKLAFILGISQAEGQVFYDDWQNLYANLVDFANRVNAGGRTRGYTKYWTGRRRHYAESWEARKAFNSLIQGGGAEIVKSAMLRLFDTVDNPDCRMLLTVHDSVVFEVKTERIPEFREMILFEMQNVHADCDNKIFFVPEILRAVNFDCEAKVWG